MHTSEYPELYVHTIFQAHPSLIYVPASPPWPTVTFKWHSMHGNMGGIGTVAEPFVVITLLVGGTWINRDFASGRRRRASDLRRISNDAGYAGLDEDIEARSISPSLLVTQEPEWRTRTVSLWGMSTELTAPNTRRFREYFISRLLEKFPFLVECWYWGLIYWV